MKKNFFLCFIGLIAGICAIATKIPDLYKMVLAIAAAILIVYSLRNKVKRIAASETF